MIYYPLTTNTINNEDKKLAIEVIKSGNITRGYYNKSVEKYFSKKFNRYALLVNSGSSANLLAMSLLTNNKGRYNLNKNDEVIIPTLCWSTSLYPIIQTGLTQGAGYVVKKSTGKSLSQHAFEVINKDILQQTYLPKKINTPIKVAP